MTTLSLGAKNLTEQAHRKHAGWGAAPLIFVLSLANIALFHYPLLGFAFANLDYASAQGAATLATLLLVLFAVTALVLLSLALISHRTIKPAWYLMVLGNAAALYFIDTYHVVLDKTMMGNVANTDFAESTAYLHPMALLYIVGFGGLPAFVVSRLTIRPTKRIRLLILAFCVLVVTLATAYASAGSWLWFDKHAKKVGAMVLPWSYLTNTARYVRSTLDAKPLKQLPNAQATEKRKMVVVLVIGETARAKNFSLYGYPRNTTPQLAKLGVSALNNAHSCATYTTASLKCILSADKDTVGEYEYLPTYLARQGVEVIWRSNNSGEPKMNLRHYRQSRQLRETCHGIDCPYDGVLLSGLAERIRQSDNDRVLVVLHQSGSHGPAYNSRYPARFALYQPECQSVELNHCTHEALQNAYDNTIVYTDDFLARVIGILKQLPETSSMLFYISDHGESLGEQGLYLHGTPLAFAPKEQTDIPFILWKHGKATQNLVLKKQNHYSQFNIFHSIMRAFALRSAAYNEQYDLFEPQP